MIAQGFVMPFADIDLTFPVQVGIGLCVVLVMVAAGGYILRKLRKSLRERDSDRAYDGLFTVEALDELLADGQITPDEYRRLRRARLGLKPENQPPADSSSSPPAPDVDAQ